MATINLSVNSSHFAAIILLPTSTCFGDTELITGGTVCSTGPRPQHGGHVLGPWWVSSHLDPTLPVQLIRSGGPGLHRTQTRMRTRVGTGLGLKAALLCPAAGYSRDVGRPLRSAVLNLVPAAA